MSEQPARVGQDGCPIAPTALPPVYVAGPYAAYTVVVDGRTVSVSEAENVRRAILVARFITALGYPVILPHVTGQAVFGEDTPEVRARVLPDCLSTVAAVARAGGMIVAIAREDGSLSTGTGLEWKHYHATADWEHSYSRPWSEWADTMRARGIDPDENIETVWSLRSLRNLQAARIADLTREREAAWLARPESWERDDLLFAARQALHRSGAPTCGPEGAPISLGYRVRWVCDRLAEAEEEIQRRIDAEAAAWAVLVDAGVCVTRFDGSTVSLAEGVAALEGLAPSAGPQWQDRSPTIEEVRAHEERGGLWMYSIRLEDDQSPRPGCFGLAPLRVHAPPGREYVVNLEDFADLEADEQPPPHSSLTLPGLVGAHAPLGPNGEHLPWPTVEGGRTRPATRPTTPCDTGTGPTTVELAADLPGISPAILADLQAREAVGVERYGAPLRGPWAPAATEAYQETLDLVAYLLVAPEPDARRLAGEAVRLAERVRALAVTGVAS